jgi:hypothetical protein
VRTLSHLFAGATVPDGYGVLTLPDQAPVHLLLELDRGTESSRVLREKAEAYANTLPYTSLRDLHPIVILAVPGERRAQTATAAVAGAAPITVAVWTAQNDTSPLAVTLAVQGQIEVERET